MDNDFYDFDGSDDTLKVAEKTFNRMADAAKNTGYREGIEAGSEEVLQEHFDNGYADGYKIAFVLGHYKGLAMYLFKDIDHPQEIQDILEITRRGACYICTKESSLEEIKDDDEDILIEHRKHTLKECKKLKAYFDPLLKAKGVDEDGDIMKQLNLE